MPESTENNGFAGTSLRLKIGLAEMLKGGVIMDVMSVEQARIAEESGAASVMALERVPAMIRAEGGVARMARPSLIKQIIQAVSIPVMAKARIGHTAEAQILQELGVDFILEGSVRREGDRVRITAQLVRTKDQTHIWANSYDRNLHDILTLQNDVSSAIAAEIRMSLTAQSGARLASASPRDPDAYEAYLEGRYFWNKRSKAGYLKAIEYFGQAIARDPNYARAYAGLADAYALLGALPLAEIPRSEAMYKAKAAASTALPILSAVSVLRP